MFRIATDATFTTEAVITVPGDDGTVEQTLTARFRLMPKSRANELLAAGGDGEALLREVVVALDGAVDEEGKAIPSSPALIDELLDWPFVCLGLVRAYFIGSAKLKLGN